MRCIEGLCRPLQIARDESDLGFGHNTSRPGHSLARAESPSCPAQEYLRANEIAKLGHGNAAKGESRRILSQGDALQGTQGIAGRQRARRGRDQRVHLNPVTLVTPTSRCARSDYLTGHDE